MGELEQIGIERRKHPRRGFSRPGVIRGPWGTASVTTADLSETGLSIQTWADAPLGRLLEGVITAPGGTPLAFVGEVRWRRELPGSSSARKCRAIGIQLSEGCSEAFSRFLGDEPDQDVTEKLAVPEESSVDEVLSEGFDEVSSTESEIAAPTPISNPGLEADAPTAELKAEVLGLRQQLEEKQSEVEALDRDNAALRLETEWLRAELAKRGKR